MKTARKFRLLMFDLGGVIIDYHARTHFAKMAGVLKVDDGKLFIVARRLAHLLERRKLTVREAEKKLAMTLDLPYAKTRGLWEREFRKSFTPRQSMLKLVRKLSKRGYKVAIVTNTTVGDYRILFGEQGPVRRLKAFHIFASCYMGIAKPSSGYYKYVLNKMRVSADESIFVDDNLSNVKGAEKIGVKSILFQGYNRLVLSLRELGVS